MILVTGSVRSRPETFDEVLRLSREHVARSRGEPGCLSHAVHVDSEDALRLVFVERWADLETVKAHISLPDSRAFGQALARLAAEAPDLQLYDAVEIGR